MSDGFVKTGGDVCSKKIVGCGRDNGVYLFGVFAEKMISVTNHVILDQPILEQNQY